MFQRQNTVKPLLTDTTKQRKLPKEQTFFWELTKHFLQNEPSE